MKNIFHNISVLIPDITYALTDRIIRRESFDRFDAESRRLFGGRFNELIQNAVETEMSLVRDDLGHILGQI